MPLVSTPVIAWAVCVCGATYFSCEKLPQRKQDFSRESPPQIHPNFGGIILGWRGKTAQVASLWYSTFCLWFLFLTALE